MTWTVEITVPDSMYRTLLDAAQQTGQSIEAIAAEWLQMAARHVVADPLDAWIGSFDSHGSDWADKHDRYLGPSSNKL